MLLVDSVVLLEVNYGYESSLAKSSQLSRISNVEDPISQYYLLMGSCRGNDSIITECIPVAQVNDKGLQSVQKRIELLLSVNDEKGFKPLAFLIVNSNGIQDNNRLCEVLRTTYNMGIKLEYDPCRISNGSVPNSSVCGDNVVCMEEELKLKCYRWEDGWFQTDFQIRNETVELVVSSTSTENGRNGSIPMNVNECNEPNNNNQTHLEERTDGIHLINYETFTEETKNQEALIRRLMKRLDSMINYLTKNETCNEEILIKISLLIKRLEKPSTNDINIELMSIENEIKLLQIICNQWEIIN